MEAIRGVLLAARCCFPQDFRSTLGLGKVHVHPALNSQRKQHPTMAATDGIGPPAAVVAGTGSGAPAMVPALGAVGKRHERSTSSNEYPPLNFFYSHLHNSIKSELESLARWVWALGQSSAEDEEARLRKLLELRERYRFLEQVYKYHSSVEDEVRGVPPARAALLPWVRGCPPRHAPSPCRGGARHRRSNYARRRWCTPRSTPRSRT